jgi:hypothetical protein
MTRFGYTLMTEQSGPKELVAYAVAALLSDGWFTLGLGSGENLNEHVVGQRDRPDSDLLGPIQRRCRCPRP